MHTERLVLHNNMDTRGQGGSIGIWRFFLSLIVGAALLMLALQPVADPLLAGAHNSTTNATFNQGTTWMQAGVNHMPTIFVLISFFGLIAGGVYWREVLR